MPAELRVSEKDLAEAAGVPRDRLRAVRRDELEEGVDWAKGPGGAVMFTRAGAKRCLGSLGVHEWEEPLREKEVPKVLRAEMVVSGQTKNPRVVMARVDGVQGLVRLHVPHAAKFLPGMRVPGCVFVERGLWRFVGRCPRWRGKW